MVFSEFREQGLLAVWPGLSSAFDFRIHARARERRKSEGIEGYTLFPFKLMREPARQVDVSGTLWVWDGIAPVQQIRVDGRMRSGLRAAMATSHRRA